MWNNFISWMEDKDLMLLLHSAYIDYPTYQILEGTRDGVRTVFWLLLTTALVGGITIGKYL